MLVIKPPSGIALARSPKVFLAGSIEMGTAELWQDEFIEIHKDKFGTIYNPRRDNWDSSWEQKTENDNFYEQVRWELNALDDSDHILMYFDPKTKSPISLLELGLYAKSGKLKVYCPEGFWRKGNVDIVCERYKIRTVNSKSDFYRID